MQEETTPEEVGWVTLAILDEIKAGCRYKCRVDLWYNYSTTHLRDFEGYFEAIFTPLIQTEESRPFVCYTPSS